MIGQLIEAAVKAIIVVAGVAVVCVVIEAIVSLYRTKTVE